MTAMNWTSRLVVVAMGLAGTTAFGGFCGTTDCNQTGVADAVEVGVPFGGAAAYIPFGEGDGIDVGVIPELKDATTLTVEAWVLPECLSGNRMRIISSGEPGVSGFGLGTVIESGTLRFTAFGVADYDTDVEHLIEQRWTHVALVLDEFGDMHWYIDGQFVETVPAVAAGMPSGQSIHIGRNPDGTESWRGGIDEVRIWDRVRSPQEIFIDRNRILTGDELGLVAYWRFEEGQGGMAADLAGRHDGVLSENSGWALAAPDMNGDGVPDACQELGCFTAAGCADGDQDGRRDDPCIWALCAAPSWLCQEFDVTFGDVGGAFGDCFPDGVADGNDRYHVLQCFAGHGDAPDSDYACEPHPPHASNVDPAGPFGSCQPDGVCDGHDAFAVLSAFDGTTTCSCTDGPAPAAPTPRAAVEAVALTLASSTTDVVPGGTFEVGVVLATSLKDLRGYQLHLRTVGGSTGQLELVDARVAEDSAFVPGWSALNRDTQQLLVGVDGPGYGIEPGPLATFVFRATESALGTFAVELLVHDPDLPDQRSALFGTAPQQRYRIVPAAVSVVVSEQKARLSRTR